MGLSCVCASHLQHLTMFVPDLDPTEPKVEKQCYETAVRLIAAFDGRELRRWGENSDYKRLSNCRGAVLVFLPGIAEIDNMMKALMVIPSSTCLTEFKLTTVSFNRPTRMTPNRTRRTIGTSSRSIPGSRRKSRRRSSSRRPRISLTTAR